MYYKELFKLCNYSDEEIQKEAPRIEKVFKKAEIGPEECKRGVERLHKYFWMESQGVRKEWGIWMKQFIDQVLCKEEHEKVIYYTYPLEPRLGTSINLAGYYAATPEFVNMFILGLMFDIAEPYFDLAEASGMAPGAGHCGANKMRLGGFLKGLNPMPDVFLVSSFFCDNESKTDELIDYHFPGIPRIIIDNCLDSPWDAYPNNYPYIEDHRIKFFGAELENVIRELDEKYDVHVGPDHLNAARMEIGKLYLGFQRVLECQKADPMPIANNNLLLFYMMITNPERRTMAEGLDAINILAEEGEKLVEQGKGVTPKGAPRIAWTMPWFTDPAINAMVEESGLAPVVAPFFWVHPKDMTKTDYHGFEKTAQSFMRMGMTHSVSGLIFRTVEVIKHFDLEGIVWNGMYACRPVGGFPQIVKKEIEEQTGVPVLTVETDQMDTRDTPMELLRTRIETYAETLRIRKATAGK